MIRWSILSGRQAGGCHLVMRYPSVIGRGAGVDWVIEEDGVWERHARLELDRQGRFHLFAESGALVVINGVSRAEAEVRNGDVVDLGAARLRFALSETRLRSHRAREWATWIGVALLCLGQILMIYVFLP